MSPETCVRIFDVLPLSFIDCYRNPQERVYDLAARQAEQGSTSGPHLFVIGTRHHECFAILMSAAGQISKPSLFPACQPVPDRP
jgi:hypothetical protein